MPRAARVGAGATGPRPPRVLMVTSLDGVEDRIGGLDDGADAYLVKPFVFEELTARLRALLRRGSTQSGSVVEVGDVSLDTARHEARRGDTPLALTPKEFALLRYPMLNAGRVHSEGELLIHVWDENANLLEDRPRHGRHAPAQARRCGRGQPIETIVGAGYRLRGEAR